MTRPVTASTSTAGVYLLGTEHAGALVRFASDPTCAALLGIVPPLSPEDGVALVERLASERLAGTSMWSVVIDHGDAKGVAAVLRPYDAEPIVAVWIDPSARRRGYGELETGGGSPDGDSVFIRLRDPFRTKPVALPDGVVYTEPNDPQWWKADYATHSPRHILAC